MANPVKRFCYPLRFATANPTVRVRTDGIDETLTLAVDTDTDYYMSGNGDAVDLVLKIKTMLRTATAGATYEASLSDTGFLTLEHLGASDFALLLEHAGTTVDTTIFGWPPYDTAEATSQTAPYQAQGIWDPGRTHLDDSGDEPILLGSVVEAAGDGSRAFVSDLGKRERRIEYDGLRQDRVSHEAAPADRPFGTFEYAWNTGLMCAADFRVYDDRTIPEMHRTYRAKEIMRSWERDRKRTQLRKELELDLLRTADFPAYTGWSLALTGTAGYSALAPDHSSYDVTAATWSYWVRRSAAGAGDQYMLSRIDGVDNAWGFLFPAAGTELRGIIASGPTDAANYGTTSGLAFPTDGTWKHVAWVYDGALALSNRLRLYVDGAVAALSISGTIPATLRASALGIRIGAGANASSGNFGPGNIAHVTIWSVAKTRAQINAEIRDSSNKPRRLLKVVNGHVIPPTECVAYFPLQNNFRDRSTLANHAARTGAPVFAEVAP